MREDLELEKAEELLKKSEEATEEFFAAPEEEDDDEDDEDYVPMEVDASAPDKSQAGIFVDTNLILLFDLPFYGLMCLGCTLGLFVSRRNILLHRLAQSLNSCVHLKCKLRGIVFVIIPNHNPWVQCPVAK